MSLEPFLLALKEGELMAGEQIGSLPLRRPLRWVPPKVCNSHSPAGWVLVFQRLRLCHRYWQTD